MKFNQKKYTLQGVGEGYMFDGSGNIKFYSKTFQDSNIACSGQTNEIRAGTGNGIVQIIEHSKDITVTANVSEYDRYIKAASFGAKMTAGAPIMTCQTVIATGATLTADIAGRTPVAPLWSQRVVCFITDMSDTKDIEEGGIAYDINPATGEISGFVAESGKSYSVTYFVSRANAILTTFKPSDVSEVVTFVVALPFYVNFDSERKAGNLAGFRYKVIPRLKLLPDGASTNGQQTAHSPTLITGKALSYEPDDYAGSCDGCGEDSAVSMYTIDVFCDASAGIDGIVGELGSAVSVAVGENYQLQPKVIVADKLTTGTPPSDFTYSSSAAGKASVSNSGLITGVSTGNAKITIGYDVGGKTFRDFVDVTVTAS